jgi:hypothetical protein
MATTENTVNGLLSNSKIEDEKARHDKRLALKQLNENPASPGKSFRSSDLLQNLNIQ